MWKCEECGCIFEEDEMDSYQECVGEFWGFPAYETFYCCPNCNSEAIDEYDETEYDYEEDE